MIAQVTEAQTLDPQTARDALTAWQMNGNSPSTAKAITGQLIESLISALSNISGSKINCSNRTQQGRTMEIAAKAEEADGTRQRRRLMGGFNNGGARFPWVGLAAG